MEFVYFILFCGIYLFMIMIQYGNYRQNLLKFSLFVRNCARKKKNMKLGVGIGEY